LDWLGASLDLIKIFAERGGKRIICLGSCSEYDWSAGGCFSEYSSPVSPSTFYGQTKDALRRAVQGYAAVKNLPFLWGRLFWPYGPGEAPERLLTSLARLMMAGQKAGCRAGNLKRDYIYIDDAAEALAAAICSNMEGILNIASGESVPLGYLAETLAEMLGLRHRLSIGSVPVSPGNPEEIKGDIRRLREELNWQPRFTIEAGLKVMADHLKR
jgi:nucleoside-diphosphate-sugar epimerase